MSSSTAVHSNAFNFLSFVEHGVDPRTGQYTMALSVPEVKSHALAGPALPLSISFNPLNTRDGGLGKGWGINLTEYNPRTSMLSLGTGETFKVTGSGSRPDIAEKKLDSFHFHVDGGGYYRVVHRSGLVEVLQDRGGSQSLALPVEVLGPDGRGLQLSYVPFAGADRLERISDGTTELLRVTRSEVSKEVQLQFYPGQGEGGAPLATYVLQLDSSSRVTKVVLPTTEKACWRMGYETVRDIDCVTEVWTPAGAHETIEYRDAGHPLPGGARPALPRVTRQSVEPGFEQAPMDVHYTYSDENFLGHRALSDWSDDGLDNLYRVAGHTYRYHSIAEHWLEGKPKRTVQRIYNRYHLLTDEITVQGKCRKTVSTLYYADHPDNIDNTFAQQPAQCQLPMKVETIWEEPETHRRRVETLETRFDVHGNLTELINADGTREVSEYFPVEGEAGACPPDPEGFVRTLWARTVYPAPSEHGNAPTLRSEFSYLALQALPGMHSKPFLVEASEALLDADEKEWKRTETEYFDNPEDTLRLGRPKVMTETLNGKATATDYQYATLASPRVGEHVLQVVETITGFDGSHRAITQEHSLLNGEPLLVQDEQGVEIRYVYDALARVVLETVAPGTGYAASREYGYHLVGEEGDNQAWQLMVDVKGVQTRSWLDGVARPVKEERQDVDAADDSGEDRRAASFRTTYEAKHNGLGELTEEKQTDWLQSRDLILTTSYSYDDWGERASTRRPDRVSEWDVGDPIGLPEAPGVVRRSWLESTAGIASGVTETWQDLFGENVRIERVGTDDEQVSLVLNHYDGLGRLAEQIDARDRSTTFVYDVFDRLVSTTLPGGAVVAREYAPHSSEDLPTRICVGEVELGTQVFDGLDRLVEATTGGRKRTLHYYSARERPDWVLTPAQRQIDYEYQPQLGEEVSVRRMPDAAANYTYDPHNSRLTHCTEQGVGLEREYYSNGQVRQETRRTEGQPDDIAEYDYSLEGRLLRYEALGMWQEYLHDGAGRVEEAKQGTSTSILGYDTFGRVESITTTDSQDGNALKVEIGYDDFGRESWRTFTANGVARRLELGYDTADALSTRVLLEGDTPVRSEEFFYDLRSRLQRHECDGTELPVDAWGNAFTRQVFVADDLDNITKVHTFAAGGQTTVTYHYSTVNPVQLESLTVEQGETSEEIKLAYDADGNLTRDEQGRRLVYDPLGRMIQVDGLGTLAERQYRYDALDLLVGSRADGSEERRFYVDDMLAARAEGTDASMFLRAEGRVLAEQTTGTDAGTVLLATDQSNTVLREVRQGAEHDVAYTAYGFPGQAPLWTRLGYNGQQHETVTHCQLLGSGYRTYNPVLMRFHSTDSESPFGGGGVNGYGYVHNDPVNHVDPSGHFAWWAVGLVVGGGLIGGSFAVKDENWKLGMQAIGGAIAFLGVAGMVKAGRGALFRRSSGSSSGSVSGGSGYNGAINGKPANLPPGTPYDFSSPKHMQRRGGTMKPGTSRGPDPAFASPTPPRSFSTGPASTKSSNHYSLQSAGHLNRRVSYPSSALASDFSIGSTSSVTFRKPFQAPPRAGAAQRPSGPSLRTPPPETLVDRSNRIRHWVLSSSPGYGA